MSEAAGRISPSNLSLRAWLPLLVICAALFSCQSQDSGELPLPDGLYPVLASGESPTEFQADSDQCLVIHDMQFQKSEIRPEPTWLLMPTKPGVSLDLAEPPTESEGALNLKFTARAAKDLRTFTHENIGNQVAVVIGGEVVTVHMIRSAIDGGRLQISC